MECGAGAPASLLQAESHRTEGGFKVQVLLPQVSRCGQL